MQQSSHPQPHKLCPGIFRGHKWAGVGVWHPAVTYFLPDLNARCPLVVPPSPGQLGLGDTEFISAFSVLPLKLTAAQIRHSQPGKGTGKGSMGRLTEGGRIPGHHPGALSCFLLLCLTSSSLCCLIFRSSFHLVFGFLGCCSLQSYRVPLHLSYLGFLISTIR